MWGRGKLIFFTLLSLRALTSFIEMVYRSFTCSPSMFLRFDDFIYDSLLVNNMSDGEAVCIYLIVD